MNNTVENLNEDVGGILTGIDLNEVDNLYGCYQRAVSTFIQRADVPETSNRQPIYLYDGVYDYIPGGKIFGAGLIDVRPQGIVRNPWDSVEKTYQERFDREKGYTPSGYFVTYEYYNGVQIMRISQNKTVPRISIDPMSNVSGWVAAGGAQGLALDTTVYYHEPGALVFNLVTGQTEGTLTKTLTNPLNLTSYPSVGVNFLAFNPPSTTGVTAIKLRLGSNSSNYYEVDVTKAFLGPFIANDYQLVAFNFAAASTVGSPVITQIQYVQLIFEYTGSLVNVRVGDLWISLPSPNEIIYYSNAVFIPEGSTTPLTTISSVNDTILFSDSAYNIFVREAARAVAMQAAGAFGASVGGIDMELNGIAGNSDAPGLYAKYRGSNPSEELRVIGNWYEDDNNYGR